MPSQSNTSLYGFNRIIAGSGDGLNRVSTVVKSPGGSNAQFHGIPVQRDSAFAGNANNQINNQEALANTAGGIGPMIAKIVSGSGIGVATHRRKGSEVGVSDPMPFRGGVNSKLIDTELVYGSGNTPGGPLRQLRDGRWVNSSGVFVSPLNSGVVTYKNIIAGSGDREAPTVRNQEQQYHYKMGSLNSAKTLPKRTD